MNRARLVGWRAGAGEWPGRWRRRHRREPGDDVAALAPYNLWVTPPPLTPATRPHALPTGLTVDEAVRISEAITAAHAESTRTVYDFAWSQWQRWCAGRGATAMPAEPALICAYLTERAAEGLSVGTIDLACGAIAYRHRMDGLADPVLAEGVRQVRRGLRRIICDAPRRQARPLGTEEIFRIVERIDRTTPLGARDAAIILLGFASAMRRSELAALTLADVARKPGGVLLAIRRSKTDQYGEGQVVAVVHGQRAPPTRSPPSTPGSPTADANPARCSPASTAPASTPTRSPATPSPACCTPVPRPPGSPPSGSPPTPCAPDTPPPPPWPASPSSASPPRPDTATSPSSSSATSAHSTPWPPPPAATSDSDGP
jgi:hypothetical protein